MLTKKSKKLTLILFYSEYSMAFLKAQSILKKVIEDLGPIGKLFWLYIWWLDRSIIWKKCFLLHTGVDFKTMNKDIEPSAFWRAKGVFIPHLVSIMDSNLIVYQESFQSVDNIISKNYN